MDHCLEDLSHDQGDPHDQEVSAHDAGGVNGTGPPSHDAGCVVPPRCLIKQNFTEVDDNSPLAHTNTHTHRDTQISWSRRSVWVVKPPEDPLRVLNLSLFTALECSLSPRVREIQKKEKHTASIKKIYIQNQCWHPFRPENTRDYTRGEGKDCAARRRWWSETAALSTSGRRRRAVHLLPFLYALMKSVRRKASLLGGCMGGGCV